jgi:hypothetical protein
MRIADDQIEDRRWRASAPHAQVAWWPGAPATIAVEAVVAGHQQIALTGDTASSFTARANARQIVLLASRQAKRAGSGLIRLGRRLANPRHGNGTIGHDDRQLALRASQAEPCAPFPS